MICLTSFFIFGLKIHEKKNIYIYIYIYTRAPVLCVSRQAFSKTRCVPSLIKDFSIVHDSFPDFEQISIILTY